MVEVAGRGVTASCSTKIKEGMVVWTNTARVRKARRVLYELMLSDHPDSCLTCKRNQKCEFQKLGELMGITEYRFEGEKSKTYIDTSSPALVRMIHRNAFHAEDV